MARQGDPKKYELGLDYEHSADFTMFFVATLVLRFGVSITYSPVNVFLSL